MFYIVSSLVLLILLFGWLKRHDKKWHIRAMSTAFVLDVLLVLIIELNRHAVEKAVTAVSDVVNPLLIFHVAVSVLTLVLYGLLSWLGIKLAKGDESARKPHAGLAGLFAVCRLTNFVTSFWVVS